MNWIDKVTTGKPLNKTTSLVVSENNEEIIDFGRTDNIYHIESELRIPFTLKPDSREPARNTYQHRQLKKMIGRRSGKLTVIGLMPNFDNLPKRRKKKGLIWVVQCDCGRWTHRRGRKLKNQITNRDSCVKCERIFRNKNKAHWLAYGENLPNRVSQ